MDYAFICKWKFDRSCFIVSLFYKEILFFFHLKFYYFSINRCLLTKQNNRAYECLAKIRNTAPEIERVIRLLKSSDTQS